MTKNQELASKIVGRTVGMALQYKMYTKMGAPRWTALALADITSRLVVITEELHKMNDPKHAAEMLREMRAARVGSVADLAARLREEADRIKRTAETRTAESGSN